MNHIFLFSLFQLVIKEMAEKQIVDWYLKYSDRC
jgi:hypothetical protein